MEGITVLGKVIYPAMKFLFNKKSIHDITENLNFDIKNISGIDIGLSNISLPYYKGTTNTETIKNFLNNGKNIFISGSSGIGKNRTIYEVLTLYKEEFTNYKIFKINLKNWIKYDNELDFLPKSNTIIIIDDLFIYDDFELKFLYDKIMSFKYYNDFGNIISFIFLTDSKNIGKILNNSYGEKILDISEEIHISIQNYEDFLEYSIENKIVENKEEFDKYYNGTPASVISRKILPQEKIDFLINEVDEIIDIFKILKFINTYIFEVDITEEMLNFIIEQLYTSNNINQGIKLLKKEGILINLKGNINIHLSILNLIEEDKEYYLEISHIIFTYYCKLIKKGSVEFESQISLLNKFESYNFGTDSISKQILKSQFLSVELKNTIYIGYLNKEILNKLDYVSRHNYGIVETLDKRLIQKYDEKIDTALGKINKKHMSNYHNNYTYLANISTYKFIAFLITPSIKTFSETYNSQEELGELAKKERHIGYIFNYMDRQIRLYCDGLHLIGQKITHKDNLLSELNNIEEKLISTINLFNKIERMNNIHLIENFSDFYSNLIAYYLQVYLSLKLLKRNLLIENYIYSKYKKAIEHENIYKNGKDISIIETSYSTFANFLK